MKYLYASIVVVILSLFISSIYEEINKDKSGRSKRVACQLETVCFEKIDSNQAQIDKLLLLLSRGSYNLESEIVESIYMETKLFKYLDTQNINSYIESKLKELIDDSSNSVETSDKVDIKYYIYENDKEDKGKKSEKSKLYAGYLLFEFKINRKIIYKIQIDFMDMQGKDITKRVNCIFKSLVSLKKI